MATQPSHLFFRLIAACLFLTAVCGALAATTAYAQDPPPPPPADAAFAPASPDAITFTAVVSPVVTGGLGHSNVAWGDYDNDGYLDQLLSGCTMDASFPPLCTGIFHRVYHNNAGAGFTLAYTLPENGGQFSRVAWGDYNNDNKLDILLDGWYGASSALLVLQNTGSGFSQVFYEEGLDASSFAWGDYNNDGLLDFIVGGWNFTGSGIWVYRNNGIDFTKAVTLTANDASSALAWGDYDNDGRLDILATTDGYGGNASGVYRNTGVDFTRTYTLPNQLMHGGAAWGDYDNDGRLDFAVTGQDAGVPKTQVVHNTAAGFVPAYSLTGYSDGSVAWGDYDSDNRLDLLVTGEDAAFQGTTALFRNTVAGFNTVNYGLANVSDSSAAWGDYDNDGRLDILLTGCNANCDAPVSAVYKNNGATPNTPPTAPTNLRSTVTGNQVLLQWNAPTGAQSAIDSLSYNLYVTPTDGVTYALAPMANVPTGFRRLPALGNAQLGLTASLSLTNGTYVWSVQAIDGAWSGGPWQPTTNQFIIGANCVTTTNDSGPGSLRQAVADAPAGATICFDASLAGKAITLASPVMLVKDVRIIANVPITVSGEHKDRAIYVVWGVNALLRGLTIRDASTGAEGGGIESIGNLTVDRCTFTENSAGSGAAIGTRGVLTVSNSTFIKNYGGVGGAIFSLPSPGQSYIMNSTFISNTADWAGAIEGWGPTSVSHSTFRGNSARIYGTVHAYRGSITIDSSVLSDNGGGNCYVGDGASMLSGGYNVSSDGSCGFGAANDFNNVGPQTQPLQPKGTVPLLATSLGINNVTSADLCTGADAVGTPRTTPCDSGALEFTGAPATMVKPTLRASLDRAFKGQTVSFTATVQNTGAVDATNLKISLPLPAGIAYKGAPSWTSGYSCSWAAPNLTCTTTLPRAGQFDLYVGSEVTTQAVNTTLALVASAQATGMASPSTSSFKVVTRGNPPFCNVGPGLQYPTIQAAVNAAQPNATILVCATTFNEKVSIAKNITIRGVHGAELTFVDPQQNGRAFDIASGARVTLEGFTIRNGAVGSSFFDPGQIREYGGGIKNAGVLTVNNCVLSANKADVAGAIYNTGILTISQSSVSNNTSNGAGGALENNVGATLVVKDSILGKNSSQLFGGAISNYGTARISFTTINDNRAGRLSNGAWGGGIANSMGSLTVENSIFRGNSAGSGLFSRISTPVGPNSDAIGNINNGVLTVNNSILQPGAPVGSGANNKFEDPLFVRNPGAYGWYDPGDPHLRTNSPATGLPATCAGIDLDGTQRKAPCSAGAYEYSAAKANGLAEVVFDAAGAATGAVTIFTNTQGIVKLDIPSGAVTQTVQLAFSLGQFTGGDGRSQGVVFTPYTAAGQPLPVDFSFEKPLIVTLGYDPDLVTNGLEIDLAPRRFDGNSDSWLPFTSNVAVDVVNQTITFAIFQTGEYGLFSTPPDAHANIIAGSPTGVRNLGGGAVVTYTLEAQNSELQALTNLELRHTLPTGVTFGAWVQANGATRNGNTITWDIPTLAGGGAQQAIFSANVSSDAQFWDKYITSTVTLEGPGSLSTAGQTRISVNGPTIPVTDSVATTPNTPVTFQPLANDLNPDLSQLVLAAVGSPAHGTATIAGNTVTYTPSGGFEGVDAFSYTVQDGQFTAYGLITVRVARLANFILSKTVTSDSQRNVYLQGVPPNSTVIYQIDLYVTAGGDIARSAVVTDALPAGIQFTKWITQAGATINGKNITWSATTVPTNTVTTVSFEAIVAANAGVTVANTTRASASNADPMEAAAIFSVGNGYKIVLPQVRK